MADPAPARIAVFAFAATMGLWVPVGGQLYVAEAIAVLVCVRYFPYLTSDRYCRRFIACAAIWSIGQGCTDLIRNVEPSAALQEQALIWFLLVDIVALRCLITSSVLRAQAAAAGFLLAAAISVLLQPSAYALEQPWKFGFAIPVSIFVATLAWRYTSVTRICVPVVIVLAGYNLFAGFRSEALILIAALAVCIWQFGRTWVSRLVSLSALVLLLSMTVSASYSHFASDGSLGSEAKEKYMQQSRGQLGAVGGGRPEFVYTGVAIYASPLIGLGSEARDRNDIYMRASVLRAKLGYRPYFNLSPGIIPLHSHVLGAWAKAGLLSLAFWATAITICIRGLSSVGDSSRGRTFLLAFVSTHALWDIFFSPLGASARFQLALLLALATAAQARREMQ